MGTVRRQTRATTDRVPHAAPALERRVNDLGQRLAARVNALVQAVPGSPRGPVPLAKAVGTNKVLTSRLLRAAASRDPVATLRLMPGPDPLRKLARSAGKRGVDRDIVAGLETAADDFDALIRGEAGDRGGFDAILAAWLPEARAEFELRRKQAAFKSNSELRGQRCETQLSTVLIHTSPEDPDKLDVVWLFAFLGLARLRPNVTLKFASRRIPSATGDTPPRRPQTLAGDTVDGLDGLRLDAFCSSPPPTLHVRRVGEAVHYFLAEDGFGPKSAVDLAFAEVNRRELPRAVPPAMAGRRRHFFAEVNVPSRRLVLDVFASNAARVGQTGGPELFVYDTAFEGVANVNDPSRDVDRLETSETLRPLGRGMGGARVAEVPWYSDLLAHACDRLGWDPATFEGHRARVEYPIYGTQVTIASPAPVAD